MSNRIASDIKPLATTKNMAPAFQMDAFGVFPVK
ncbi:uncharacterized protein METZ01_LOCUS404971 [marine metagenome]|uniref:Uncharacterized protein n=1 Tax=marine metagenome TaxID=408172 RepID=A0A382W016_9ZZZZ